MSQKSLQGGDRNIDTVHRLVAGCCGIRKQSVTRLIYKQCQGVDLPTRRVEIYGGSLRSTIASLQSSERLQSMLSAATTLQGQRG